MSAFRDLEDNSNETGKKQLTNKDPHIISHRNRRIWIIPLECSCWKNLQFGKMQVREQLERTWTCCHYCWMATKKTLGPHLCLQQVACSAIAVTLLALLFLFHSWTTCTITTKYKKLFWDRKDKQIHHNLIKSVDVVVNYTESKWSESSRGLPNIRWNHLKNVAIVAVNNDEERSSCKGKNITGVEKVIACFTKYSIAYSPQNLKCKNNFTEGHPKNMIQMVFMY